jgi:hydroxymethylbilane synthase
VVKHLRLATRKSLLAMTQSSWVKDQIESAFPGIKVEFVPITTKGDKILDVPLAKVGGKGLFVKEIEQALLSETADFAVHSLKDVPIEIPEKLEVSIFPKRHDPRDVLVSREGYALTSLPQGSKVGTSSLRRIAQLRHFRPDFNIIPLRGNLDTRLKKLSEGQFDAIVLAAAGLHRLGLTVKITEYLSTSIMIPAVGQGALAIEFRKENTQVRNTLFSLHDPETAVCVRAERAFLTRLQGGCQVPIGAFAEIKKGRLFLTGLVGDEDGMKIIIRDGEAHPDKAEELGNRVASEILNAGGDVILKALYAK